MKRNKRTGLNIVTLMLGVTMLTAAAAKGEGKTRAEIKEWKGAPAIFINGKPSTALMHEAHAFKSAENLPAVSGGKLRLQNRPGTYGMTSRCVKSTNSFGNSFMLEAEVAIEEFTADGTGNNIVLWVNYSPAGCYFFHLSREKDVNVVHLWKAHPGASQFDKWFTLPLNWKTGETVNLKLVVNSGKISGYANGTLVGEKIDENPLPPASLTISAYHSISSVNFVKVTDLDGRILLHDDFSEPRAENWSGAQLAGDIPTFASAGVNISLPAIQASRYGQVGLWKGPGQYDFEKLDSDMRSILATSPDAYIIGRVVFNPPDWWIAANPSEMCIWKDSAGGSGQLWYASFSSEKWRKDTGEFLEAVIRHIEESDYADRVIGYNMLYAFGPEWEHPSGNRFHDYGVTNTREFRKWLTEKYGTDEALSRAWNRKASIATADIPAVSDRLTGDKFEFFDPAGKGNRIGDYIRFNDESVVSAIEYMSGIIKRVTGGRVIVFAHYGYHFMWPSINFSQRGHQALDKFLDIPHIDGSGSAYQYRVRYPGGSTVPITTVASFRLHGKTYILEDDTRTHLSTEDSEYGRARNLWETTNILKRNSAYTISEGIPLWYLDFGNVWFEHKDIMPSIAQMADLHKEALNRDRKRNAEIAVIVNQRSVTYLRSSNAVTVPVLTKQYFEQIPKIGAPFDSYILQDLDNMPDYKLYIFLDTFALNEKEKESIRRVIRQKGRTALWIYAPGYITENGLSDEAMSEITGIKLLSKNIGGQLRAYLCDMQHPITEDCSPGTEWEAPEPIGPIITSRDKDAGILGMLHASPGLDGQWRDRTGVEFDTGLAVKEFEDWRSVWCGVPNMPADLLRGIAKYAGVHIYSDGNDFLCANSSMLSIHAAYAGKRTIKLPKPAKVVDAFTGEIISEKTDSFDVDLKQYETGMWWLEY
ncbi:MAG: beta-galactosidase [Candidatus Omnitrophica bacterium]|nr:beta-galactosidase [Candidatus Omnitrophota bacterium]